MKTKLMVAVSAVAVAALAAAPAVAKSRTQQHAQVPAYSHNTVVQDGQVLGADPDAFIRNEIRRDGSWYRTSE
jgi:opacity protein-like surface antigen